MRNIYRVSAAGYWCVVNAASISAATAKGLRNLNLTGTFADAEKKGRLSVEVKIVKRNVHQAEQPKIEDYREVDA